MEVKQIYQMLYDWEMEVTGGAQYDDETPAPAWIIKEDLSNIVDVGTKLLDQSSVTTAGEKWRDNFVRSMIDRIGRMVFVDRVYTRIFPDLRRDSWEYGSIMTKSRVKRFRAKVNPSWTLTAGQVVEQFAFEPPEVMTLFYNAKDAWQIDCSFADIQLREAFTSPREMDRFLSMIRGGIERSFNEKMDLIASRTLNGVIAEKLNAGKGVIDVLALYNATLAQADQITAEQARTDKGFLRYLAYTVLLTKRRMAAGSGWYQLADEAGYEMQTPADRLRFALHSDFAEALRVFLESDTYHNEMVKIGSYDSVPCWQTSGSVGGETDTGFDFDASSRIYAKLPSDNTQTVNRIGIIGIMWDWDACAICNENRRVTSAYNANGEYWTNFYKCETHSIIDMMENSVVFVVGTGAVPTITISGTATCAEDATSALTATTTNPSSGLTVAWSSDNTDIATVSSGTVTGVAAGKCNITASITVNGTTYTDAKEFTVTAKN